MKGRPDNLSPEIEMRPVVLEIEGLTHYFDSLRAVHDFSVTLKEGELVGLIGPNGAGKTTIFNLITGVYRATAGSIRYEGAELIGLPSHEIIQMGIARTFQNIRLFANLTVLDNVLVAYHPHAGYGLLDAILRSRRFRESEKVLVKRSQELLAILGLEERQNDIASSLPYGLQRRLEIARALATQPYLLLLDEPAAGMNPGEVIELMDLIHFIRDKFKLTIFLVEHQMRVVMGICEWITVMDFGEIIARGTPREIQNDPKVIEAYLGKGAVVGVRAEVA